MQRPSITLFAQAGVDPQDAVYIGDSEVDVAAATVACLALVLPGDLEIKKRF